MFWKSEDVGDSFCSQKDHDLGVKSAYLNIQQCSLNEFSFYSPILTFPLFTGPFLLVGKYVQIVSMLCMLCCVIYGT